MNLLIALVTFLLVINYNNKNEIDSIKHSQNLQQYIINSKDTLNLIIKLNNKSGRINDGEAIALVTGGIPPYTYKWTKKSTTLFSSKSIGLTEGKEYNLTVSDRAGSNAQKSILIYPESVDEKINAAFVKPVEWIEYVVMVDFFDLFKLYDSQIYDKDHIKQFYNNGDSMKVKIPFVVLWIIIAGLFFTYKFRFINIFGFKHSIALIQGKYDKPKENGEVSHFQALTTALSATVGLGNIAGVAIAITLGGPGATFWMIVAGFLGMSLKFAECTLGVKYREIDSLGKVSGGPMYYLSKGLAKRNMSLLGKVLAGIFAVVVIGGSFGGGNMFQANQTFSQLSNIFPIIANSKALFGVFFALLVGVVIIGGIKSIAKVTEKIVPFMAAIYILGAIIIIAMNINHVGEVLKLIFFGAFTPAALKGGIIGVIITGFQRAAFSNEAGIGSAPIAHSAVKTSEPISEGIVSLLEPFIDTVIICSMTSLVIIFTGLYNNDAGLSGVELTSAAFNSVLPHFDIVLSIAIVLFAFSTMISWSYYGVNGFNYLFNKVFKKNKVISNNLTVSSLIYYIIFLIFIVIGSASSLGTVIDFSDMMILAMAFPNIIGLFIMSSEIKKDLKIYQKKLKTGEIKKYK